MPCSRICLAAILSVALTAGEPAPHPGEPADHRVLIPTADSTAARIWAREHLDGPPRIEPVYTPVAPVDHWDLTLPKLHPAGADATLTVAVRAGAVANGWVVAPSADNLIHYTSTYRLTASPTGLNGAVRIGFLDKGQLNSSEYLKFAHERVAIIEVTADAQGVITGKALLLGGDQRREATITGRRYSGGRPPVPQDRLAAGAGWPGYRGPAGCGAAKEHGNRLVDDLSLARPVWKADHELPDGRAHSSGGGNVNPVVKDGIAVDWLRYSGAKSSPVVADGCVYTYTMVPSGTQRWLVADPRYSLTELQSAIVRQAAHAWLPGQPVPPDEIPAFARGTTPPEVFPQPTMFCIGADDVVFCFDAQTGALRWKTVYPAASANYGGSKGGPQLTPFVADGRIYALGSTERIYCLDAKTGKEIWQSHTGWSATAKDKILRDRLAAGEAFPVNRSLETALVVAEGVVICSDNRGKLHQKDGYPNTSGPGLIGLDAATGKRLWQTPEGFAGAMPCRWVHGGRTYILADGAGAAGDRLRLLDPKTGGVLWEVPCLRTGMGLVASEDYAVANTGTTDKDAVATGFRITPQKAERIWTLPGKKLPTGYHYAAISGGHLYFSPGEGSILCAKLSDGEVVAELKHGGGHTGGGHFLIAGEGRTISSGICFTGLESETAPITGSPWRAAFAVGYLSPMEPALADGRLFLRDKTGLVCYDLRAKPAKP
ncbi:hypothetical protein LBMAG53_39810 [Planctomycetota bacterium]|nr:hypothetical protein LBMAG53_39810 [Planctomycetota bacterium]